MGRSSQGSKLTRKVRKYRTRLLRKCLLLRYALVNRVGSRPRAARSSR